MMTRSTPSYLKGLAKEIVNLQWKNDSTFPTKDCGKVGRFPRGDIMKISKLRCLEVLRILLSSF